MSEGGRASATGQGFELRAANRKDQPGIRALIRAVRINPLGIHWRRFTLAVDEDGHLVGCGQIKQHTDGSRELASIAVVETWRGQGVATTIIRHLLRSERPPLWLICRPGLMPFYKRFGFRRIEPGSPMPPYFRRILRLSRILIRARAQSDGPAIMAWQETCTP